MNFNVYELSVPAYIRSLTALSGLLTKAQSHCEEKKIEASVLLQSRLIADQFPLGKQIQIACDNAKFYVSSLTQLEAPPFPDTEATFEEFQSRIEATLAFLKSVKAEDFEGCETRNQSFRWRPDVFLSASDYILHYAIPNVYFHLTTAYSILRANGVDVGKTDFLGNVNWQSV